MKKSAISSFSVAMVLLVSSSAALADSHKAPPAPPVGEDYADSYGYVDANGRPMPAPQPYGAQQPYYAPQAYGERDDEHQRHHDEEARVAGGLLGGAGGAVAGTFIAGHGSRLAGGLIGGGVGALVGLGVGALLSSHHHHHHNAAVLDGHAPSMGYDYGAVDDTVMTQGHWVGSMTGSWNGGPVRTWQGTFDSSNGQMHWHGQYVDHATGYVPQQGYRPMGYPRGGYGYRYAQPMYEEMMVQSQPIITKTVETHVSYVDVPVRTVRYTYKRVWHPAYHPAACSCAVPRTYHKPKPKPQRIMGS